MILLLFRVKFGAMCVLLVMGLTQPRLYSQAPCEWFDHDGDGDGDGNVTVQDILVWLRLFG